MDKFKLRSICLLVPLFFFYCTPQAVNQKLNNSEISQSEISQKTTYNLNEGLADLSSQIAKNMVAGQKRKIAILPFSDLNGNIQDFGKFIADELIDLFFMTKKFDVVERSLLDKILQEHELTITGMLDVKSAKKLGLLLGADAIASGTYTVLSKSVRVRARIIDVETATVFAVAKTEFNTDVSFYNLLGLNIPSLGRWDMENESVKKMQYDEHMKKAIQYLDAAAELDDYYNKYDRQGLFKAALLEIVFVLSLYPEDKTAKDLKKQIETFLGN